MKYQEVFRLIYEFEIGIDCIRNKIMQVKNMFLQKLTPRGVKKSDIVSCFLLITIIWALYLKLRLVSTLNVHWDEFNFLGLIYKYQRGELSRLLQTFHVHLFNWLTTHPGHEVEQVIIGRYLMYGFTLVTLLSLWHIGRSLMNSVGALTAIIFLLTFSFQIQHGASFRYDPVLVACFMVSVGLMVVTPYRSFQMVGAGVLAGVSFLISIKALFFVPTWGVLLGLRTYLCEPKLSRQKIRLDIFLWVISALITGVVLLLLHKFSLHSQPSVSSFQFMRQAGIRMFSWVHIFPRKGFLYQSLVWDFSFWGLLFVGLLIVVADIIFCSGRRRVQAGMLLALALPLLSLIIYNNSYPYFYVTIIPSASLLAGLPLARLATFLSKYPYRLLLLIFFLILPQLYGLSEWFRFNAQDHTVAQRALLDTVHKLFPEPVAYIDRCSMVASYRKVGPFMTAFVMGKYRSQGQPIMGELLEQYQPMLLLENIESLDLSRSWKDAGDRAHQLLASDFALLKDNYIRYWGRIWVPGKKFPKLVTRREEDFTILIGGKYQVKSEAPVVIDFLKYNSGAVLKLETGCHRVAACDQPTGLVLTWASLPEKPQCPPSTDKLFTGFHFTH